VTYSTYHISFSYVLNSQFSINKQDVLDYPQNYFGPNYKELLNFWFYWDSLSEEQCNAYWRRHNNIDVLFRNKANEISKKLASEVIDGRFVEFLYYGQREIIAAHLYLERNIPFTFLPLIFDL
jgi:hypothetical protein